jgi:sugar phosphate permease
MNSSSESPNKYSRWIVIFCLVFGGEMIFSLPFHVARYFRPLLLEVLNLTQTELGDVQAMYGIMAMIAYFPGGLLADRFSARKLMALSLVATGLGGFYFAQLPGQTGLYFVFGWWGVTTVFLFWAALIKSTREWGGNLAQGKAFGILDGGRGLMAAAASSIAVIILSFYLPDQVEGATELQRKQGMRSVIYLYTGLTILSGILVWFFVSDTERGKANGERVMWSRMKSVFMTKTVWLQAVIVVCAYCAYKGGDYYAGYAMQALDLNELEAPFFVSYASYFRAVAAIAAGFIVDRFSASKVITWLFGLLAGSYILLAMITPTPELYLVIYIDLIITFIAFYGLRGVYFALLQETKVSSKMTGTAVGLISVVGYTPDVFFYALSGRILDASPGFEGYQHFYLMLAGFSVAGMLAVMLLVKLNSGKISIIGQTSG